MAAPAFVRKTEGNIDDSVLTLNIEVSAGSNRVLVVGLAYRSSSTLAPSSITFNGTENFTVKKAGTDAADAQCFLAFLTAPTETTADVVITMPSSVRMVGYVAYYTGADQTNPFTANIDDAQGNDAAPTIDISSASDESCIDIMCQVSGGPDTATPAHTVVCNGASTGGGSDCRGAGQRVVGTTTRTMNYTMSDTDDWNIVAGALQEPQAADLFRTINDDMGVTDPSQPVEVKTIVRAESESLGVTDASQPVVLKTFERTESESLGITDARTPLVGFIRSVAESLGIADARVQVETKVLAEALGLTDTMSRTQTIARVIAEALGIVDAQPKSATFVRVVSESLGITDEMIGVPSVSQSWQINVTKG